MPQTLKEYITENNLLIKDLGEAVGYNAQYMSLIVGERCKPGKKLAIAIEKFTNGSVLYPEITAPKPKKTTAKEKVVYVPLKFTGAFEIVSGSVTELDEKKKGTRGGLNIRFTEIGIVLTSVYFYRTKLKNPMFKLPMTKLYGGDFCACLLFDDIEIQRKIIKDLCIKGTKYLDDNWERMNLEFQERKALKDKESEEIKEHKDCVNI